MRTIIFSLVLSKKRKVLFSSLFVAFSLFVLLESSVYVQNILNNKLSWITKMPEVDLWLVDAKAHSLFTSPLISREVVLKMRMLPEVRSASPLFVGMTRIKGGDKALHLGVDETTLLGAPIELSEEKDKRGVLEKGFFLQGPEPFLYTSYRQAAQQHPEIRSGSPFILIKLEEGRNVAAAAHKIEELTHCKAYSKSSFAQLVLGSLFEKESFPTPFFSFVLLLSFLILFLTIYFFLDAFTQECALLRQLGASFPTFFCTFLSIACIPTLVGYMTALLLVTVKFLFFSSPLLPAPQILALSLLSSLVLAAGIGLSGALKAQRRLS